MLKHTKHEKLAQTRVLKQEDTNQLPIWREQTGQKNPHQIFPA